LQRQDLVGDRVELLEHGGVEGFDYRRELGDVAVDPREVPAVVVEGCVHAALSLAALEVGQALHQRPPSFT